MKNLVLILALVLLPLSAWARCDATPVLNLSSKESLINRLIGPSQAETLVGNAAQAKINLLKDKITDAKTLQDTTAEIDAVRTRCTVQAIKNLAQYMAATYTEEEVRELAQLVGPGKLTTDSPVSPAGQPANALAVKFTSQRGAAIAAMMAALPDFDHEADMIIKKAVDQSVPSLVNPYMPPITK